MEPGNKLYSNPIPEICYKLSPVVQVVLSTSMQEKTWRWLGGTSWVQNITYVCLVTVNVSCPNSEVWIKRLRDSDLSGNVCLHKDTLASWLASYFTIPVHVEFVLWTICSSPWFLWELCSFKWLARSTTQLCSTGSTPCSLVGENHAVQKPWKWWQLGSWVPKVCFKVMFVGVSFLCVKWSVTMKSSKTC